MNVQAINYPTKVRIKLLSMKDAKMRGKWLFGDSIRLELTGEGLGCVEFLAV